VHDPEIDLEPELETVGAGPGNAIAAGNDRREDGDIVQGGPYGQPIRREMVASAEIHGS